MRPFKPLFTNPHLLTILGYFWPRKFDFTPYPIERRLIRTDPNTQVLVQTQRPANEPIGEVILLHGLEGAGNSGYIVSMAWAALQAGFVAHRFHMRTCGGTAALCKTLYHGGLTSDLRGFLEQTYTPDGPPRFLVGFSLGANVCLKLAGELGDTALINGACALSAPLDLGLSVRRIAGRDNRIYENRFVKRMKQRLISTGRYSASDLAPYRTLYDIDDKITAPSFGMGNADNYYDTQSAKNFLDRIRVPTLVIQAKDDTYIPFEIFSHPAFSTNPFLKLCVTEHGGHLGHLQRGPYRFWLDEAVMDFLTEVAQSLRQRTLTSP
jgi:predicted alpha/beta-fold hydrolase